MKIYISGKISNLQKHEYEANFTAAENACRALGYTEIINPIKLDHSQNTQWEHHMITDIAALFQCNAIFMMRNWQHSEGARIEHFIAEVKNFKIIYE